MKTIEALKELTPTNYKEIVMEKLDRDINKYKLLDAEIKVIDISDFIKEDTENQYQSVDKNLALIIAPNGKGAISDYEAIFNSFDSINDVVGIKVTAPDTEEINDDGSVTKHISITTNILSIPLKKIIDGSKYQIRKGRDFFTKYDYNPRCEYNFNNLVEYLTEINFFEEQ